MQRLWFTDADPAMQDLYVEILPQAEGVDEEELVDRLTIGDIPDGLVIDGWSLREAWQSIREFLPSIRNVLVCTSLAEHRDVPAELDLPNITFLEKPFSLTEFEAAIERLAQPRTTA